MSNSPLISIILPTYNRSKYLKKTIDSILSQKTEYTYEIIIVDDASSDNTEELIQNIDNKKIQYIRLITNSGGGKARNTGIANARGKYVAFIDSDTTWHEEKIQRQIELLEKDNTYIGCYSRFVKISKSGSKILPKEIPGPEDAAGKILLDNFIDTPTSVIRRKFLDKVGGFDEKLPRFQDWELFIRLTKLGKFYGFHEPLIDSLDLADSISRNDAARLTALKVILNKHKEEILKNKSAQSKIILKIINAKIILGKRSDAINTIKEQYKNINNKAKMLALLIIATPREIIKAANKLRQI
ncbi:putative teichuronic acid biosynthesis glycosyltransferase TuaG [compost metagenome]